MEEKWEEREQEKRKEEAHGQGEGDKDRETDRDRVKDGCRVADMDWSCTRMGWPACSVIVRALAVSRRGGFLSPSGLQSLGSFSETFGSFLPPVTMTHSYFPRVFPRSIMCAVAI